MSPHTTRPTYRVPSPALVVAVFALLVALGGTGYALSALPKHSVGPAQLKKNAVKSKAVKDHTLRAKDFRPGELPPSDVFVKYLGTDSVPVTALTGPGAATVITSMSLPAGTYYVRATGYGDNHSAVLQARLVCSLGSSGVELAPGAPSLYVPIQPVAGTNAERGYFSLDAAYRLSATGTVSVACSKGAMAQNIEAAASLTALKVAHVTAVP